MIIEAHISIGCSFCACVFFISMDKKTFDLQLFYSFGCSVTLFAYLNRWFPFSGITELVNNVLQPQQKQQNEKEPQT